MALGEDRVVAKGDGGSWHVRVCMCVCVTACFLNSDFNLDQT